MILPHDSDLLRDLVAELDTWKTRLDYRGPIPRTWAGRLRRDLEAEAVAASTSMEGVPVTVEEVHRILAGDVPPETREADAALVRGYRDAMSFVLRRADDAAFRWDRELVINLHDRILAGSFGSGAGRLRTGQAYVVDNRTGEPVFQPPPPDEVPELVNIACSTIGQGLGHPAIAAAWIHVTAAAIHPFQDGNGRVARVRRLAGDVPGRVHAPRVHLARGMVGTPPGPTTTRPFAAWADLPARRRRHAVHPHAPGGPAPSGAGARSQGASPAARLDRGRRSGRRRRPRPARGQRGVGRLLREKRHLPLLPPARRRQPRDGDQ